MGVEGFSISRLTGNGRHHEIRTRSRQWYVVRSSSKQSKAAAKFWRVQTFSTDPSHAAINAFSPALSITTNTGKRSKTLCWIYKNHQPPAFWKNHCSTNRQTNQTNNRPRGNRKTEASERPNPNEGANAFCHATPPRISYPKYSQSNCCC